MSETAKHGEPYVTATLVALMQAYPAFERAVFRLNTEKWQEALEVAYEEVGEMAERAEGSFHRQRIAEILDEDRTQPTKGE